MKWYKTAQDLEEQPYNVFKVGGGQRDEKVDIPHIYAVSPDHARTLAMIKYPYLRDFIRGCLSRNQDCDIRVALDKDKWQEIKKYRETKKDLKEEYVQEAWWNK
jgi:hypothetical protein